MPSCKPAGPTPMSLTTSESSAVIATFRSRIRFKGALEGLRGGRPVSDEDGHTEGYTIQVGHP